MCSQCLRAAARLFALRLFCPLQACLPLCFRTEKVPSCTCPHPVDIDCLRILIANPPTILCVLLMHTRRSSLELADGEALRSLILCISYHCCLSMGTLWMIVGWLRECLRYYGDTDEACGRAAPRIVLCSCYLASAGGRAGCAKTRVLTT